MLAAGLIRGSCAVHVQCFAQGGNANGFSIGVAGTPTLEECNVRAIAISAIFPFIEPGGEEPEHFECRLETKWLEYKILVSSAWHGPDIYQQMVQSGAVVNDCDVHSAYQGMGKGVKNDVRCNDAAHVYYWHPCSTRKVHELVQASQLYASAVAVCLFRSFRFLKAIPTQRTYCIRADRAEVAPCVGPLAIR